MSLVVSVCPGAKSSKSILSFIQMIESDEHKKYRIPVVCGMHRSGTSLLSSILIRHGVDMGTRLLSGDPSNPSGHFEDLDFVDVHKRILADHDAPVYLQSMRKWNYHSRHHQSAKQIISDRMDNRMPWGWKDPRTCLFVPFWLEHMPCDLCTFVILVRDYSAVVESLLRRDLFNIKKGGFRRTVKRAFDLHQFYRSIDRMANLYLRSWIVYNRYLLRDILDANNRCLVVEYEKLFDASGVSDICKSLGLNTLVNAPEQYHPAKTPELKRAPVFDSDLIKEAQTVYTKLAQHI
jgi:sulfotransferase family protein